MKKKKEKEKRYGYYITYINSSGFLCEARIDKPDEIVSTYYKSKRNSQGKYEKVEITAMQAFLRKLNDCRKIKCKLYEIK